MTNVPKNNKNRLIYPGLSYKLMGILFDIHNHLGPAYQEKYYQRAIEAELKTRNLDFAREKYVRLNYKGEFLGKYFIDFVIEEKIILETKTVDFFRRKDIRQVLAYLSATGLKLAILVNFNREKLLYRRVVNPNSQKG